MLLREELACQSQTCYPLGNDCSTMAHIVRSKTTCSNCMWRSNRCNRCVTQVLESSHPRWCFVALLSNLLRLWWTTGLMSAGPMTLGSISSMSESRVWVTNPGFRWLALTLLDKWCIANWCCSVACRWGVKTCPWRCVAIRNCQLLQID